MADAKSLDHGTPAQGTDSDEPRSYGDWVTDVSYRLNELAYQAKAARALLRECEQTEEDETLTGVSYLLTSLFEQLDAMSVRVSNSEFTYRHKEQETSHG
jgi:hypothetical protein